MSHDDLRDLVLYGVRWEITEMSSADAARLAAATAAATAKPNTSGRTATFVVPPIAPIQPVSTDTAVAMAARPRDLPSLCRMIAEFGHPLRPSVTNVVVPHLAANPNGLLIVTDMPGMDDDATGNILTGASGELLDKMLGAIDMSRETVSITPVLFWRTPGGRTPTRAELDLARPFLDRVLELMRPRLILTLGTLAATEIAGINLARAHGVVATGPNDTPVMPIFHPNYLLLKPATKRDAWDALQQVRNLLKTA